MNEAQRGNAQVTKSSNKSNKPRGWRRFFFRLAAILLGLTPFILLEVTLRVLNVCQPSHYDDPFVGFSNVHPLFELNQQEDKYVTAPSREFYFGRQEFAAKKPKNGLRAFCLGGSTVRGRPHETSTSFSQWLEIELNGRYPGREHRIVNCGGLSYASFRLRLILDEVLGYEPDLIILATGHNEHLEDRTYQGLKNRSQTRRWFTDQVYSLRTVTLARRLFGQARNDERVTLPDEVKARLDDESGYASYHRDDAWSAGVIDHYRTSVTTMIEKCRENNVPIILVNLGSNLRDCPPFKSEHKPGLSANDKTAWQTAYELAAREEQLAGADPEQTASTLKKALALYRQAERLDNEHGLLLFRIARCLERLGRHKEARDYYVRAKEWDVCPLRMKEAMHQFLGEVAAEESVPLIDARRRLEELAPHNLPGFDLYVDHVHPTIASHQKIAQMLFNQMQRQELVPNPAIAWTATQRRTAYRRHVNRLSPTLLNGSKQRIQWLENWARREKLAEETRPVDAAGFLRLGNRHLEIGRTQAAGKDFKTALTLRPDLEEGLMEGALQFINQGRPASAQTIVSTLLDHPRLAANRKNHHLVGVVVALERDDRHDAAGHYRQYKEAPAPASTLSDSWSLLTKEALARVKQ